MKKTKELAEALIEMLEENMKMHVKIGKVCTLLEEYSPDAIWNIECKLDYIEDSVKVLKDLGYIK